MSNQSREPRSRIVDYILLTLALPVIVWMELNEMSEDISLALTGGKYSGRGRLNRKKYRDEEDEPPSDWKSWKVSVPGLMNIERELSPRRNLFFVPISIATSFP